jgi:hypothetical protein
MGWRSSAILVLLALSGGLLAGPALAGVPRVVIAEEFGRTT